MEHKGRISFGNLTLPLAGKVLVLGVGVLGIGRSVCLRRSRVNFIHLEQWKATRGLLFHLRGDGEAGLGRSSSVGVEFLNLFGDVTICVNNDTFTVRSVFVIGPDKKVKLTITYPASTGRNFDEVLRVIDSLQLTAKFKVATPANWQEGNEVIIGAAVSDDEAKTLFPGGWKTVKPYLRVLPQPK